MITNSILGAADAPYLIKGSRLPRPSGQGGLSDVQPLSGIGEVQFLSDGDEIPQVAQMRVHSTLLSESGLKIQPYRAIESG